MNQLRQSLDLLTQRINKKFYMRIKRIKENEPLIINTDDTICVYCENDNTTYINPKEINSDGLIIGIDLADETDYGFYFGNLNSIEDKITLVEMINDNI